MQFMTLRHSEFCTTIFQTYSSALLYFINKSYFVIKRQLRCSYYATCIIKHTKILFIIYINPGSDDNRMDGRKLKQLGLELGTTLAYLLRMKNEWFIKWKIFILTFSILPFEIFDIFLAEPCLNNASFSLANKRAKSVKS